MLPRVLHLVETLQLGGTETQAVQTALHQHSIGQQVMLACLCAEGPLVETLQRAEIPIVEFRKQKKLWSIQGVRQLLRLALFLRHNRIQVLHAHDLMSNLLGVPAARLAGTPTIISSRRYLDLEWWRGSWRNRITAWIYSLSTHVVVNSRSIRDLLVMRDGVQGHKIRVVHNAIGADRFAESIAADTTLSSLRRSSVLVAVVANMYSPVKGHATLIAAAKDVCREFPHVRFVLIGDGVERPKLEQHVKELALEKHFLFLGSRKNIAELLAACDLFVLPSESEGLPNALLEAMAAGLPVIATSVGGVPEVIEHEITGLLIPPSEPVTLSKAIVRLLKSQELRRCLGHTARQRAIRDFSFERLTSVLQGLYVEPSSRRMRKQRLQSLQVFSARTAFSDQAHE